MDEQARVTVVIPAYKAERTIRRAVDSALAQQDVEAKAIVVVDGVLDATLDRLQGYDPARVTVLVNERNSGAQVSRNRGLAAAEGEFVMFLDCDDFIEGPMLRGLVGAMRESGADLGFGPWQVLKEEKGVRLPVVNRNFGGPVNLFWNWLSYAELLSPCAMLWRTDFIRRIGGWNEAVQRNQDGEMVIRAIMLGAKFVHSREGRGVYVHHDSADRITKRPDILKSRLDVGEMILARESAVIPDKVKRGAVARYFYRVALNCYSRQATELGDRALHRARELGFSGHTGPLWHRMSARLLGVKARYRLTNFVKRRRLFGFRGL
ncbi:MAG TPA: glycosyltransferase family A protein [Allosphingosinicella sp.]|nr:glycosyltransferase family A protein [Allosphingosinicella sp.]